MSEYTSEEITRIANSLRVSIKNVAAGTKRTLVAMRRSDNVFKEPIDIGEVLANLTLAYRHLEDASQRLGKVIQAADGGVSVYDKETTVGA